MFLFLSKVLDLALSPLTWALVLGLVALWQGIDGSAFALAPSPGRARLLRRPRLARAVAGLGLALLTAFSLRPVSVRLFAALERSAVDSFRPSPPYDVVIVLGGVLTDAAYRPGDPAELGPGADRIVRAAQLLRDGQARQVLLSGGNAIPVPGAPPESERLAELLRGLGVAPERIVVEPRSRNTRENALESAALVAVHPEWKRILLLTSAWHAPRAMGCFRAAGLAPDLLTVDHRGRDPVRQTWEPRARALADSTDALRELAGGLVYRAMGYAR